MNSVCFHPLLSQSFSANASDKTWLEYTREGLTKKDPLIKRIPPPAALLVDGASAAAESSMPEPWHRVLLSC